MFPSVTGPYTALFRSVLHAAMSLYSRVDSAQRCAYAAELGRVPSIRDMARLGLDAKSVSSILNA